MIVSRLIGSLLLPTNFVILLSLGLAIALTCRHRLRWPLLSALAILTACGFGPVGTILARPLEHRFNRPPTDMAAPRGIIVPGGGIDRIMGAAILARRFPSAIVVCSGGSNDFPSEAPVEAETARQILRGLGIDASRIVLESQSRSTLENATMSSNLVRPKPSEEWILVTSAIHMPRAIGAFRKAGFSVVAYPVDYRTSGRRSDYWQFRTDASNGLVMTDAAIHEWAGLLAYRLTGKIDSLFPGPAYGFHGYGKSEKMKG